jgi:uncharacterized protein YbaR (Trm112 family)
MDKSLLDILACPSCKSGVNYQKDNQELTCPACRIAYPIEDNIPVMLVDQARELTSEEDA